MLFRSAIVKFEEALALDPNLKLGPEAEAKKLAAEALVSDGRKLAKDGKIEQALAKFSEAQALSSEAKIVAKEWNNLCWHGSLWGHAADVLDACGRAVELERNNGRIRDSRGLARALTGDYAGAIEDFQFFVEWAQEYELDKEYRVQREAWIAELEAGRNPFDAETLEELKNK